MNSQAQQPLRRRGGSRDAVETAIGLSKQDKTSSWERLTRDRIAPWASYWRRSQSDLEDLEESEVEYGLGHDDAPAKTEQEAGRTPPAE